MERQSAPVGAASVQFLHSTCNSCIAYVTTGAWMPRAVSLVNAHIVARCDPHRGSALPLRLSWRKPARSSSAIAAPRRPRPPLSASSGETARLSGAPVTGHRGLALVAKQAPDAVVSLLSVLQLHGPTTQRQHAVRIAAALPGARHSDHNKERHSESVLMALKRRTFNPKRRLCPAEELQLRQQGLSARGGDVRYSGNAEHKRNPGDFGLNPPSGPRPGKTLCDQVGLHSRAEAQALLHAGLQRGAFSAQERDGWPQNVWAVTEKGEPLEAQLEGRGVYHRYPMQEADPFREKVLKRWSCT